jgi:16S rRNA (uracil1498-N3)-methyltransferase
MRTDRFFIPESNIANEHVTLSSAQAHQICNVLKLRSGDKIIVLDNKGIEYEVTLEEVNKDKALGKILQKRDATGEPRIQITLYQSLLSREKFEHVLQKCTEVGVVRFVPVITQRSIVHDIQAVTSRKMTRWRRIIQEAAEQSHRGRIPQLRNTTHFETIAAELEKYDLVLIFSPQGQPLRDVLSKSAPAATNIGLLIGPEGGFTEAEIGAACGLSAKAVTLGPRILRTETAALVTSALVIYQKQWQDVPHHK